MGNTKIRKLKIIETQYADKTAGKHMHDYSIESVARVKILGSNRVERIDQYHVMKCRYCNSFKTIPVEGNTKGSLEGTQNLPVIHFVSRSKSMNIDKQMKCISCLEYMSLGKE